MAAGSPSGEVFNKGRKLAARQDKLMQLSEALTKGAITILQVTFLQAKGIKVLKAACPSSVMLAYVKCILLPMHKFQCIYSTGGAPMSSRE
jgi:hypothetical protein